MALHEIIPVDYDKATFDSWKQVFGDSFTMRVESQLHRLIEKCPASASRVAIKFAGDISSISAEDVSSRKARVATNAMVEGKQTLCGKLRTACRSIFNTQRGRHQSRAAEQKLQYVILCTFVIIPAEEEVKSADNEA